MYRLPLYVLLFAQYRSIGHVGSDFLSIPWPGAGMAEWKTRRTQNPLGASPCGFESHSRYRLQWPCPCNGYVTIIGMAESWAENRLEGPHK